MGTDIHWVSGPWQGKLCIGPRPRGDDWLDDDIARLRSEGIDTILSLLTTEEEKNLGLLKEGSVAKTHGITFVSFPIPDMQVPSSRSRVSNVVAAIDSELSAGRNVFIHCRQGIGRTGLIASCLLLKSGWTPQKAMEHLSEARGLPVPETEEQRRWLHDYASRPRADCAIETTPLSHAFRLSNYNLQNYQLQINPITQIPQFPNLSTRCNASGPNGTIV